MHRQVLDVCAVSAKTALSTKRGGLEPPRTQTMILLLYNVRCQYFQFEAEEQYIPIFNVTAIHS